MPDPSILIFLISCFLFAIYLLFSYLKNRRPPDGAGEGPESPWDGEGEVRRLIGSTEEVRALYERLGYFPDLAWKAEGFVGELKGLIRAEIPDFAAFRKFLSDLPGQTCPQGSGDGQDAPSTEDGNDRLLREVLAAGDDPEIVLDLLNRAPVDESMAYLEQLPFYKDGQLIWRTPIDLSILRKGPSDPARFARLLQDLEKLVQTPRPFKDERAGREILELTARLRKDLTRENAYFPTPLRGLEARVAQWASHLPDEAAREMKGQLDGLIGDLVSLRHVFGRAGGQPLSEEKAVLFKEAARRQAKTYLDLPWMHTPWLTACLLTNLFDSELALLPPKAFRKPSGPAAVLRRVREEVASTQYDGEENIRRLQQQEERGFFVHSLVYSLLRLGSTHLLS